MFFFRNNTDVFILWSSLKAATVALQVQIMTSALHNVKVCTLLGDAVS